MLSPEELLSHRKKEVPAVFSMGLKLLTLEGTEQEEYQLNTKLENMKELLAMERVKQNGAMSKAVWRSELNKAEVIEKCGSFWDVMGHSEQSKYYLYPEEALYLLDVAALEITYNKVPLSLQRAQILLLGSTGVTLNQYRVYSHLALLGYNLQRHSEKNVMTQYEKDLEIHKVGLKKKDCPEKKTFSKKVKIETVKQVDEEANASALKLSEFEINLEEPQAETLSKLRLVSATEFANKEDNVEADVERFFDYDVFLENSRKGSFRKSVVQLPAFRIHIVSVTDPVPDIKALVKIREHYEDGVPIIFAVVHPDFIHFSQVAAVSLPTLL